MTPLTRYTFYIHEAQRAALAAIKERDGVPESEQIRRAVQEWIAKRRVKKTARKRVTARKRA